MEADFQVYSQWTCIYYVHMGQVNLELSASQPDEKQYTKLKNLPIFNTYNQGEFKPENMQGIAPTLI